MTQATDKEIAMSMSEVAAHELRLCSTMIRTWIPEAYPADEQGQVHFARAIMEAVADAIDRALAVASVSASAPIAAGVGYSITDAMVDRACRSRYLAFDEWSPDVRNVERFRMRAALAAALGPAT